MFGKWKKGWQRIKGYAGDIEESVEDAVSDAVDTVSRGADRAVSYAKEGFNDAVDAVKGVTYEAIDGFQGGIHSYQQIMADGMQLPLAYREYAAFGLCQGLELLPDRAYHGWESDLATSAVNLGMPAYNGEIRQEQILPSGKMPFVQSPTMLSYWAQTKNCPVLNGDYGNRKKSDSMVLTYYTPLAQTFLENGSESTYDNNNKHFYSHCKSEFTSSDNSLIVINPELTYNSPVHSSTGADAAVVSPSASNAGTISGYRPQDAIVYEIDYEKLGLSKEDVETSALYVNADINVLDPQIQRSIFALEEAGYSTDEIIQLYQNDVDFRCNENIEKLTADRDCNIDNLVKADNSYKYNLTDYNCAVKPVAPLVFANERRIHRDNMNEEQANKCREELGLPNIYDQERYGKLNKDFYNDYVRYIKRNRDRQAMKDVKDVSTVYQRLNAISCYRAWMVAEFADNFAHNLKNLLKPAPSSKSTPKKADSTKTDKSGQVTPTTPAVSATPATPVTDASYVYESYTRFNNRVDARNAPRDNYVELRPEDVEETKEQPTAFDYFLSLNQGR